MNSYSLLPSLYNSFISKRAIDNIFGKTAAFFHSNIPDIYSALVFGSFAKKHIYSEAALSICGAPSFSNGNVYFRKDDFFLKVFLEIVIFQQIFIFR
tara:strand:+ start:553 stop:843 length:291 start_codon:yes stop_codon:yes gene_type:complete